MRDIPHLLTGYRSDLDLPSRWWHRLITVVSGIAVGLSVLLVALYAATGTIDPEQELRNVRIISNLTGALEDVSPTGNAAKQLADKPGRLGLAEANQSISHLSEYSLERSFCTNDAIKAASEVAAHLNQTRFTTAYTEYGVLTEVFKIASGPSAVTMCWFDSGINSSLENVDWANIIKYEFTPAARAQATFWFLIRSALALAVTTLVLANVYHRGVVYVICGPRKEPLLQRVRIIESATSQEHREDAFSDSSSTTRGRVTVPAEPGIRAGTKTDEAPRSDSFWAVLTTKYAAFDGRARRREYWMFVLINTLIGASLTFIGAFVSAASASSLADAQAAGSLLNGLYALAVFLPSIAVTVRRLHDTGHSGWWLLVFWIPVALIGFGAGVPSGSRAWLPLIGLLAIVWFIVCVVLLCVLALDGNSGPNQYGPDPKGQSRARFSAAGDTGEFTSRDGALITQAEQTSVGD